MNNPAVRRTAILVGLGVVGVVAAGKLVPSKKQKVIWGINGQLDKVNSAVEGTEGDLEGQRENSFGLVDDDGVEKAEIEEFWEKYADLRVYRREAGGGELGGVQGRKA